VAPEVQALLDAMRKLESLPVANGGKFWSSRIGQAADAVARSDAHGLWPFLGFFGGMGLLTELLLQRNGILLRNENDSHDRLRSIAWALADRLKHGIS
jgi:hypothetical protein